MSNGWDPAPELVKTVSALFWQRSRQARPNSPLRQSWLFGSNDADLNLFRQVLGLEIARLYRVIVYLTYSPERAETLLRSTQWEQLMVDERYRFRLTSELEVDLVDSLRHYQVEIIVARAVVPECRALQDRLEQVFPSLDLHLRPQSEERFQLPVTRSAWLHAWHLKLNGRVDESATARFPMEWLIAHYSHLAQDRSEQQPELTSWNRLRGALAHCVRDYGLARTVSAIEQTAVAVNSPFSLFPS